MVNSLALGLNVIKNGKGDPFPNLAEYVKGLQVPYDSDQSVNIKLVEGFVYCYDLADIKGVVIEVVTQPPITFKITL
jgi:hypothetical protein